MKSKNFNLGLIKKIVSLKETKINPKKKNQIILSNEMKYSFFNKSLKNNTLIADLQKTLGTQLLKKYSITPGEFIIIQVNYLLEGRKCHLVNVFKDILFYVETTEFLKRFYSKKENKERITTYAGYYKSYLTFFCRPIFSDNQHNKIMQKHFERCAEFHYNNQFNKNKPKEKKDNKNQEVKTIFSPSIQENMDINSLSNSKLVFSNFDNKTIETKGRRDRFINSMNNWSLINNNTIDCNSIDYHFVNDSLMSCFQSIHPKLSKESKHHHERNKVQEFKTVQFKEVLNSKPLLQPEEQRLKIQREQLQLIFSKLDPEKRNQKKNLKMKNVQIKNSVSVKTIHQKLNQEHNTAFNSILNNPCISTNLLINNNNNDTLKTKLPLHHVHSASNIVKLSLDVLKEKGRNKRKTIINQAKDLTLTSPTTNHYNISVNNKVAITPKLFNTKVFNKHVYLQQSKDSLNTRNKKQIEPLHMIPQVSHNIQGYFGKRTDISNTRTIQKSHKVSTDMLQAYYQKERFNSLNFRKKDCFNNTNSIRFNSEPFFHIPTSSLTKSNSMKVKQNILRTKMKKQLKIVQKGFDHLMSD